MFYLLLTLCSAIYLTNSAYIAETSIYKETDGTGPDLVGYLVRPTDASGTKKVPGIIIFHDWNGLDDHEKNVSERIAKEFGYVALAADMFGNGTVGKNSAENRALIGPFRADVASWIHRSQAALSYIKSMEFVDADKIAAIGYCFGGQGVLNMARFGLDLQGVASYHGGLKPVPEGQGPNPVPNVIPKIIVMTGYDDPSIPPQQVADFEKEMTSRNADWELISYSNTYHSFTVHGSNHTNRAVYSPRADRRSWLRTKQFFDEIFA